MKILNLYANLGGNRKYWEGHEITAVELDPKIAAIYQDLWPNDTVVVADAHQYLLEHFHEFDFFWASPPCPTHSKLNRSNHVDHYKIKAGVEGYTGNIPMRYPDMALYQEIVFLKHFFKGKYCVENVVSYYDPLIKPQEISRHYFWSNFYIAPFDGLPSSGIGGNGTEDNIPAHEKRLGFDLAKYTGIDKKLALRDMVHPALGKHILDWAQKEEHVSLFS